MNTNYLCMFKFFDRNRRRLGLFAQQDGENLIITIIPCARCDSFRRKKSREIYENLATNDVAHEVTTIPVEKGNARYTFYKWAAGKYRKVHYKNILKSYLAFDKRVFEEAEVAAIPAQ